jgi:SAM-dependent methyltransferase
MDAHDIPSPAGGYGMTVATETGPAVRGAAQGGREQDRLEPGHSTAVGRIVDYRLSKLRSLGILHGTWLDCGCAEGGYTQALLDYGAERTVGVDVESDRIEEARSVRQGNLAFEVAGAEELPFDDSSFDGVFLNEVLEHVQSESQALEEVKRVLRPGGQLALFSPNRWFPLEGHGIRAGKLVVDVPVPLVPWLPIGLTRRIMRARNYWPGDLRALCESAGLDAWHMSTAFPQFEIYRWIPRALTKLYWKALPVAERLPLVRWLGVSVFIAARKPTTSQPSTGP